MRYDVYTGIYPKDDKQRRLAYWTICKKYAAIRLQSDKLDYFTNYFYILKRGIDVEGAATATRIYSLDSSIADWYCLSYNDFVFQADIFAVL